MPFCRSKYSQIVNLHRDEGLPDSCGSGQLHMERRDDMRCRRWTRVWATGKLVDQRCQMEHECAATLATMFSRRVRDVLAVLTVDGLANWDAYEAMLNVNPNDLAHEIPPVPCCTATPPSGQR